MERGRSRSPSETNWRQYRVWTHPRIYPKIAAMNPTIKFILEVLVIYFGLGFLFGYFMCAQVIRFHARVGSKPPFPPDFLNTKTQWGLMFGVCIALAMAVIQVLTHYKLM